MRYRIVAVALASVLLASPALGHNNLVHQDMTDLAYELMLAVRAERAFVTGPGPVISARPPEVAAAEWDLFVDTLLATIPKLRALPAGLPAAHAAQCADTGETKDPDGTVGKTLGQVDRAIAINFITGSDCGIRAAWTPGGFLDGINAGTDFTGTALGFWAQSIDDEKDDTHLTFRITNVAGLGAVREKAKELTDTGFEVLLLPFVCAWDCLMGSCGSCGADARDLAKGIDPVGQLEGLIPGVFDVSGLDYVGMWHFINMRPGARATNDNHPGLLYEQAGPIGVPDAVEVAIMAIADISGWSVDYDKSQGVHRYQIQGADDAHPNTLMRNKTEWELTTFAHAVFEPVDNLGFYGWERFRADPLHKASSLAWPLHAIGDATVPMHAAGTSGWGHRPFEDATENKWKALRFITVAPGLPDPARPDQITQAQRIVRRAFEWWRVVRAWRAADSGRGKNVPVRDLVTAVARQTYDYAMAMQTMTGDWPFNPVMSTTYLAEKPVAVLYYEGPLSVQYGRPLIENGVGAILAFLISSVEAF
jgi:hypothetical protein